MSTISIQTSGADPEGTTSMEGVESAKPTYISYRKKYRKMKHQFEEKMKESSSLFKEEQRALDIARRLQEQNEYVTPQTFPIYFGLLTFTSSQLLDLLLDVNNASRIPPQYRFDLASPTSQPSLVNNKTKSESLPSHSYDAVAIEATLEEARAELAAGDITQELYNEMERSLSNQLKPQLTTLESLLSVPHTELTLLDSESLPEVVLTDNSAGYLTPAHEDDYLFNLDNALNPTPIIARQTANIDRPRPGEKSSPKDRDMAAKNPVSVYNWLRKNEPQVFLQDNEGNFDKHVKAPNPKTVKRTSVAPKPEPEVLEDEFGLIPEIVSNPRAKKKRDDEPYRPKGGSSRPAKRKREDGDKGAKKVRKIAAASNGT
ncbi:MAG: hypothetical protein M1835_000069 [Candelina submexicana]|nr:MAG: hypothetical protein M1835_000069 [Candelina submexicana]